MFTLIQIILLSVVGLFTGYLLLLSIFALLEKKQKVSPAVKQRRFTIVVPAYNEEDNIARTVQNLLEIDYPLHLFDVIVVADNCTDRTAEIAVEEGAMVWERNNPDERGKGFALRWCFDQLNLLVEYNSQSYDAAVVVDADSLVSKNLLKVFNNYMEQGAEVIQGYLTVAPKPDSWTSETIRIGLTLYNYVRPLGRRRMGFSAGLRGNGMCFSISTLKKIPWTAYSQTEDLEYAMELLLHDTNVVFAPEIIGYNDIPENSNDAESQRERWEIGRFPVQRKYAGRLLKTGIRRRSFKFVDTLIDLLTPPLVLMLLFIVLMASINFLTWMAGVENSLLFLWLWLIIFAAGCGHAVIGFIAADADKMLYRSLIFVPRYAIWKLYLYMKVFFVRGRATSWVRTVRRQESVGLGES